MIDKQHILIVDDMHESIHPLLRELGYNPIYKPDISREGILNEIEDYVGLIIRSKTAVNKELLDRASNLKFLARAGSGMDNVDINYLESKGIVAINAPEGNCDALGEHALGLLLSLLHKINHGHSQITSYVWDREGNRGIELQNKTVGIYGVGHMGRAFAGKLRGLGCKVVGYDKFNFGYGNEFIKELSLGAFKNEVEILSIHVPLYKETKHLFDLPYLETFPKLKVLMNTARGKITKTTAIIELLEREKLYGVALDVLENEKMDQLKPQEKSELDALLKFPNVILTPHVGGWSFESYERINRVICDKLKAQVLAENSRQ